MQEESTITSREAWQADMLSRWSDGGSRAGRSIGRVQTLGTHIGVRKVTSAFAVATMRVALRMALPHQAHLPSGARKLQQLSCDLTASVCRTFAPLQLPLA